MSLVESPGLLTTLSAQCYIKYKANSLEDEFCRTIVNKDVSSNADINRHVQSASLDHSMISKYNFTWYRRIAYRPDRDRGIV